MLFKTTCFWHDELVSKGTALWKLKLPVAGGKSSPASNLEATESVGLAITKLVESLPPALRGSLPSPKELIEELKKDDAED
jgi:hypothetical protein